MKRRWGTNATEAKRTRAQLDAMAKWFGGKRELGQRGDGAVSASRAAGDASGGERQAEGQRRAP